MSRDSAADALRFHGGMLAAAAMYFGRSRADWMDLSTGISPWAYPIPPFDTAIWRRLPDSRDLAQLEATAAKGFGVTDAEEVVAVPGSDIAIRLLGTIFANRSAALLPPIYSGHQVAWPNALETTLADASCHDLLILANPNNPDGRRIAPDQLRKLSGQLIVDEAFAEADPQISLLPNRAGAVVLRSFGKFFGLPGARLGFVVADLPITQQIRKLIGDWPISGSAIVSGIAAYSDQAWQQQQRKKLDLAANELRHILERAGLHIVGGTSLFVLVSHDQAAEIFEHLGQSGILVRPFANDKRLLRFGLPGNEGESDRLNSVLQNWKRKT